MNTLPFKKILTVAAIATAALVSPASHASAIINNAIISGLNNIQDTDADRILRFNATTNTWNQVTSGNFQNGDVFQALLRFDVANSNPIRDAVGVSNYNLWAYSELSIHIDSTVGGINNIHFTAANVLNGPGSTSLIDLYELNDKVNYLGNNSLSVNGTTTTYNPDTGIAAVRAGTKIADFGLVQATDFWTAQIPVSIASLGSALPGSGIFPSGVFGLSLINNPGNVQISHNGIVSPIDGNLHDIVGGASTKARETNTNSGWNVSTDTTVFFNKVPEPDSLALLGLGAILLSASAKRRQNV